MKWFIVIITSLQGAILPPVEFDSLSDCSKTAKAINDAWDGRAVAAYCVAGRP